MASAGPRKISSQYNVYTWVAKVWDDRKKREHHVLLGNLELLPKNPYPYNKEKNPNNSQQKTKSKTTDKIQNKKKGPW